MAVNKVDLNGETLIDLTADTATAEDVAEGKTFHLASGEQATGTSTGGSGSDLGIIEAMDEPLPTPEETDPYVVYDNDDKSAYVRKIYDKENAIYSPGEGYDYYYICSYEEINGISYYFIYWSTYEIVSCNGSGFRQVVTGGTRAYANVNLICTNGKKSQAQYETVEDAINALKQNTTVYVDETNPAYGYKSRTSSSSSTPSFNFSFPIQRSNSTAKITYVSNARFPSAMGDAKITTSTKVANYNGSVDGFIDYGTYEDQYAKLLDELDIPLPTDDDDGKALVVQDGKIVYENIVSLPTPTASDAGKVPTVNTAGDAYELQTPQSGGGGRYLHTIYFEDYRMYPYLKFYSASSSKITSGTTGEKQSAFSSVEGSALYIVSDGEMYGGVLTWDSAASAAKAVYFNGSGSATALSLSSIWGEETSEA